MVLEFFIWQDYFIFGVQISVFMLEYLKFIFIQAGSYSLFIALLLFILYIYLAFFFYISISSSILIPSEDLCLISE